MNLTKILDFSKMSANETADAVNKYTIYEKVNVTTGELYNYTVIPQYRHYKIGRGLSHPSKANYLGLIIFALAVGKIAGAMGERAKPFVDFIIVFNEIITKLVIYIMW